MLQTTVVKGTIVPRSLIYDILASNLLKHTGYICQILTFSVGAQPATPC